MTVRKYSSRSQRTSLSGAITSASTLATVISGTSLMGGVTLAAGETFTVVIDPDTAFEEIVDVTEVSTNILTIVRGVDGSSALPHSAGAEVRHMSIGRDYRESNTHIEASALVHGIGGTVVGTTDTQTLTNKTLIDPVISGVVGSAGITFEGTTADANETTLTVTDPTADRTITFPDATGNVVLDSTSQTLSNKTLGSNLAAGAYKITGLADPTSAQDAATKNYVDTGASSQAAAAAASASAAAASASSASTDAATVAAIYDSFDDRYLGAKASAPTLDNDGNALLVGATYWNSTTSLMYAWSGSVWAQISTTTGAYTAPTLGSTVLTSGATIATVSGLSLVTPTIGNIKIGYTAVTASASTVILLNNSTYQFVVTGSTTQLFTLPVASTMTLGMGFKITNDSTANVTVQSSGANTVIVIPPTYAAEITCILTSGTTASSWTAGFSHFDTITGTGSVVAATSPSLTTPNLGTPSALVLTNATGTPTSIGLANGTGLPVSGITASTTTALGVGSIELGNATDTTLSRSSAGILAVEGVVVPTVSSTNTLTNKTLTSPKETTTVSATAAATTVNFDTITQSVLYYTSNATANWALNVRGNSGTTFNSITSVGDSLTITFLNTNGATPFYASSMTIDGTAVTPKWQSGTGPASGNASAVDAYTYTIVKTAATPTYTVFASQTKFA